MKIIREPSVYVVGRQTVDDAELNRFLSNHGVSWETDSEVAGEALTETAGRVCYMSFAKPRPGGNAAYLTHIKEVGHGSVLEHAVWNLLITGVSRSLTHELVRHRAGWAYSQLSQRYVDESVAEYVEPDIIANDPELHAIWLETVKQSHAAYVKLAEALSEKLDKRNIELGICPECGKPEKHWTIEDGPGKGYASAIACVDYSGGRCGHIRTLLNSVERRKAARQAARSVLPNATETKVFVTANARALRHFLEQRGSRHADPEIRALANKILFVLEAESPSLFGDYQKTPLPDGTCEITTEYRKV